MIHSFILHLHRKSRAHLVHSFELNPFNRLLFYDGALAKLLTNHCQNRSHVLLLAGPVEPCFQYHTINDSAKKLTWSLNPAVESKRDQQPQDSAAQYSRTSAGGLPGSPDDRANNDPLVP